MSLSRAPRARIALATIALGLPSGLALLACGGDDVTLFPLDAGPARSHPSDATVRPEDAIAASDTAPPPHEDAARAHCARSSDASAPDAPTDAAPDAGTDASCPAHTFVSYDFDRDPHLQFGGPTPGAWSIGHAGAFLGPALDPRTVPGACYLATHPGALYAANEDAWAELDPIDLAAAPGCPVTLRVWVWYELEDLRDAANIVVSVAGGPFQNVGLALGPSLYDTDDFSDLDCSSSDCSVKAQSAWSSFAPGSSSWRRATLDLSSAAGSHDVRIRVQFHSDPIKNFQGIYLSDLAITSP